MGEEKEDNEGWGRVRKEEENSNMEENLQTNN